MPRRHPEEVVDMVWVWGLGVKFVWGCIHEGRGGGGVLVVLMCFACVCV